MQLALQMNCQCAHHLKSYRDSPIGSAFIKTSSMIRKRRIAHPVDLHEILMPNTLLISTLSKSTSKLDRSFKSSCRIRRSRGQNGSLWIRTVCPLQETGSPTKYC